MLTDERAFCQLVNLICVFNESAHPGPALLAKIEQYNDSELSGDKSLSQNISDLRISSTMKYANELLESASEYARSQLKEGGYDLNALQVIIDMAQSNKIDGSGGFLLALRTALAYEVARSSQRWEMCSIFENRLKEIRQYFPKFPSGLAL